jgi:hypothetical protein
MQSNEARLSNISDFSPGIAGRFNQRFFAPLRITILSNAKSGL